MLSNDKIRLRDMEIKDIETIRNIRNDITSVGRFFSYRYITKESQIEWFNNINKANEINWVIELLETNKVVGTLALINIDWRNKKAEYVRLLISPFHRRRGIAYKSEKLMLDFAFNYLNLNKIYCFAFTDNTEVINLHYKTGFKKVGIFRNHIYKDGRYKDIIILDIRKTK